MTAAVAESIAIPTALPPDMLDIPALEADATAERTAERIAAKIAAEQPPEPIAPEPITMPGFAGEIRVGFEQLRAMSHDELRTVISRRVQLLDNELQEREQRRAAIETAKLASRMLELRRERALRIQRQVNFGSVLAAAVSTVLIAAVMI